MSRADGIAQKPPLAARDIAETTATGYPEPFDKAVRGRGKRRLGDWFGLSRFGVNLTRLAPGAATALKHMHARQDEFVFVLEGEVTLVLGERAHAMKSGDCAGFPAGAGVAHQVVNRSRNEAWILEIGSREADDEVRYPDDDLEARPLPGGGWVFHVRRESDA